MFMFLLFQLLFNFYNLEIFSNFLILIYFLIILFKFNNISLNIFAFKHNFLNLKYFSGIFLLFSINLIEEKPIE